MILKQPWSKLGSSQLLIERGFRDEPTLCSDLVLLSLVEAGVHAEGRALAQGWHLW